MKVRLSETELVSLIKKVLNEQALSVDEAATIANVITKKMSGDVNSQILADIRTELTKVDGKFMEDGTCAMQKVLDYYTHYAKKWWADTGTKKELIGDINEAGESSEPQFADNQKKTINQINAAITKCTTLKTQEAQTAAANAVAEKEKFSACATTEQGYVKRTTWEGFAIDPFGKGWITAYRDGRMDEDGYNIFYWELPPGKTQKPGDGVNKFSSTFSCVNGVMTINKWVKVQ
jgi:hypothetical protein